jgi:hypothetical protein
MLFFARAQITQYNDYLCACGQGSVPCWGTRIFSTPQRSDRIWGYIHLICYGYLGALFSGVKRLGVTLTIHLQLLPVVNNYLFFLIDTFVSFAIPSLQLRLTTSLLSNLDSTLKTNTQYLSIVQCRVLVLICSHILLRCVEFYLHTHILT